MIYVLITVCIEIIASIENLLMFCAIFLSEFGLNYACFIQEVRFDPTGNQDCEIDLRAIKISFSRF